MKTLFATVALFSAAAYGESPDIAEIVQRSSAAMEKNWKLAPNYSFVERDVETKRGGAKSIKTYEVTMIEGSTYNKLTAINDQPLSPDAQAKEEAKLQRETEKRMYESKGERAKRVSRYQRERAEDHAMMKEMVNAFDFKLVEEEKLDGHEVWVLDATPKPDYQPANREAKVLTGMRGRMWIDKTEYQWVKVAAEVTRPVSMFVIAKVSPGTKFVLEQEPIAPGVWLPKHFSMKVNANALGFINENSTDDETYKDYRPLTNGEKKLSASVGR